MHSEYIMALETRAKWLEIVARQTKALLAAGLSPEEQEELDSRQAFFDCLTDGDTYFMNKRFNLQVLNAVLYVAEQGCKWRGLPKRFGRWHTIYTRMNRWSKNGVLDQVFEKLQSEQIVRIKIEAFALDSTSIKVHPDGTGALKKTDLKPSASRAADGTPRFIWLPRMLERP